MTRIIGIHEVELKEGVTEEAFEQAVRAYSAQTFPPGWRSALIKSDRGTGKGKYGLLLEIESVAARDRFLPDDGPTEEFNQFLALHPEWMPAWDHIQSLVVQPYHWNDFQVLSDS
jgi:hypothetical protein